MKRQVIEYIEVSNLKLWSENPRDPIEFESSDYDIISKAIIDDKKKWNLQDFINKMGVYYDLSELPTVVKENGNNIVYDGNRRIAVLKYLQDEELYKKLNGGFFFNEEPKDLRNLTRIPCNVCDKETALKNIERKHTNSGTWGTLERDYFLYLHRNKEKSLFIQIDEQTGIISDNKKMNKRFVKDEMLTQKNLESIGFKYDTYDGIKSNYTPKDNERILNNIVELVEQGIVTTRKNRGKLKEPLLHKNPKLKETIQIFNTSKPKSKVIKQRDTKPIINTLKPRKTPITKSKDILFGKTLELRSGKINDTYRAIDTIYSSGKENNAILSIVGMSLRFLLDVSAREYFNDVEPDKLKEDSLYKDFIKVARKEMNLSQERVNYLALTNDWLDKNNNLDAVLAKFAHGSIPVSKDGILEKSYIVGDIVEYFFKKQ
ncbi:hypothetical protein [Tenacibaculum mesophilum]|uniref:hypothetical protein n=1 Tax=Tenacibaculum mesophilum TaxID=104268 RepID=UPI00064A500B|nr:hypothetical protein [Tenacibaculum mesophilum]